MNIKLLTLTVSALVLSTSVNAAIISADWQIADDNLITQDTDTGLEWLDLTATLYRSYNDISIKFGAGQEFEGWRYATVAEISDLLDAFGGDNSHYQGGWRTQNNGLFDSIAPLWGDTYCHTIACATGQGYSYFITAESPYPGHHNLGLIEDTAASSSHLTRDLVDLQRQAFDDRGAGGQIASALVRTSVVPIPAAVWLFGSGLIGLIGFARRKKK